MTGFLCLLVGFFVGVYYGAVAFRNGCIKQISVSGTLTIGNKVYLLSEMEAQSEK